MSLRQAARLRRARGIDDTGLGIKALLEERNNDEEESSTDESPRHSSLSLAFTRAEMGSWSESPSEDENDNEREDKEQTPVAPYAERTSELTCQRKQKENKGGRGSSKVNMQKKRIIQEKDDEILDCIIAGLEHNDEAKMASAEDCQTPNVANPLSCLRTDSKFLNVDSELRLRLGRGVLRAGRDEPVRAQHPVIRDRRRGEGINRYHGANQRLYLKRVLVGYPESGWSHPPGFTSGGLGVEQMTSPPNATAHSSANEGVMSMDPNLLAVFVSSYPHHAEALLELALVCTHAKLMDKAGRLVRRCLYTFEAHSSEAFHCAALAGQARLDADVPSNYTYMRALFEHMRLCDMRGCHRTACEVARLLLSLDPWNDPMGVLLYVDSFALKAGAFKFMVQLSESAFSELNLPGLAFSCCLSHARLENQAEALKTMKSALSRFPFVLEPLLDSAGISSPRRVTSPYNWRSIFASPPFSQYKSPPLATHLAKVYAACAGDIWSSNVAKDLLYDGASLTIQNGHATSIAERILSQSYKDDDSLLKRYLHYQIKDFRTPYPEFPEQVIDAGIIEAAEHGPIRMAGDVDPIGAAEELILQQRAPNIAEIRRDGIGWGNQNNPRRMAQEGTVLDLNLPVAELFWRSFLPWSRLPP